MAFSQFIHLATFDMPQSHDVLSRDVCRLIENESIEWLSYRWLPAMIEQAAAGRIAWRHGKETAVEMIQVAHAKVAEQAIVHAVNQRGHELPSDLLSTRTADKNAVIDFDAALQGVIQCEVIDRTDPERERWISEQECGDLDLIAEFDLAFRRVTTALFEGQVCDAKKPMSGFESALSTIRVEKALGDEMAACLGAENAKTSRHGNKRLHEFGRHQHDTDGMSP